MSANDIVIIQVGRPEWPRWMVFHRRRGCYLAFGQWEKQRRDGELWHNESEAEKHIAGLIFQDDDE